MQYLCDKYAPESPLYPKDAKQRAIVNHRLLFNMQFYYKNIGSYAVSVNRLANHFAFDFITYFSYDFIQQIAPMFYDVPRDEMALKKVNLSLAAFEEYLKRSQTKYAAANTMTIADLGLVAGTLPLEAIDFSLDKYPLVAKWYSTFKQEYPELWAIGNDGKNVLADLEKNPPDLSKLNHPLYPKRK